MIYSELKLVSDLPQPEEEIMSNTPIHWKIGVMEMIFPRFSYRDYHLFNKAIHLLGLSALSQQEITIPTQLVEALKFIGDELARKWWTELGLPWIIAKFAEPFDIFASIHEINQSMIANPTHYPIDCKDFQIDRTQYKLALCQYIASNAIPEDLLTLLNQLLESQYKIKKKVIQILTRKVATETTTEIQDTPQSRRLRAKAELTRQRRSQLYLIHSSSN